MQIRDETGAPTERAKISGEKEASSPSSQALESGV